jgi:hypothetical protein
LFTAGGRASAHDLAMRDAHETHHSNTSWLTTLGRWMRDAGHARHMMIGLAVVMALVLLAAYHEVLQDQMARADRAEEVAGAGVVTPALPSMNAPEARSSTRERTQAR